MEEEITYDRMDAYIGYLIRTKDGKIKKGAIYKGHYEWFLLPSLYDNLDTQEQLNNYLDGIKKEFREYYDKIGRNPKIKLRIYDLDYFTFHDEGCFIIDAINKIFLNFSHWFSAVTYHVSDMDDNYCIHYNSSIYDIIKRNPIAVKIIESKQVTHILSYTVIENYSYQTCKKDEYLRADVCLTLTEGYNDTNQIAKFIEKTLKEKSFSLRFKIPFEYFYSSFDGRWHYEQFGEFISELDKINVKLSDEEYAYFNKIALIYKEDDNEVENYDEIV